MKQFPPELLTLIAYLKKLPGVGRKTAERFAFSLLGWSSEEVKKFSNELNLLKENIYACPECGCLKTKEECHFCDSKNRDPHFLCIVASMRDVFSFEETSAYHGFYHVLGSLLSPLDNRSIEQLNFSSLEKRLLKLPIQEAILALDSTLEGDATALFLKQKLDRLQIKTTRLAFGLPLGSSLEYVDYGTLEKAFRGRSCF